ncbi:MAG: hypothetical protein CMJ78_20510 [Planctomycetaceae bacterium]|nr:hypothetical protein [Planctomycetaceae bacterium]
MKQMTTLVAVAAVVCSATIAQASKITGEYLEARTCDVYTGPCFANAEMELAGKEALMAWKVDKGTWKGVKLDGLGVAVVVNAQGTIGYDGVFPMKLGKVTSVILVDERASKEQHSALVAFAKDSSKEFTKNVVKIAKAPISLKNDHLSGNATFKAGKIAEIKTRGLRKGDCICTNEIVYYQPMTKVKNFSPAYSLKVSYQGDALNNKWTNRHMRSAFLATFRK